MSKVNKENEEGPRQHPIPEMLNPLKGIGWAKHAFVLSFYWILILDEENPQSFLKAIRRTI